MLPLETLQIIWFVLIGVLLAGYSVLDGFDLGVGALVPVLAKKEKDTSSLYNTIGPVWDGNEVWLLTGGGALFAAFPFVYASVFSGFYTAIMLLLCALIFRAVSLEFWSLDKNMRPVWKTSFTIASITASILLGVALGNLVAGIPLNEAGDFTGTFFTLFRPFPLIIGVLGFAAILMQGASYAMFKTSGSLRERAVSTASTLWYFYAAAFIAAMTASQIFMPELSSIKAAWVFSVITALSLGMLRYFIKTGADFKAFLASSTAFVSLWGITGSVLYPALVRSTGTGPDLTLTNSSSSQLTLSVMLIIALIGMPMVITYTAYVYKIFKGRQGE